MTSLDHIGASIEQILGTERISALLRARAPLLTKQCSRHLKDLEEAGDENTPPALGTKIVAILARLLSPDTFLEDPEL